MRFQYDFRDFVLPFFEQFVTGGWLPQCTIIKRKERGG